MSVSLSQAAGAVPGVIAQAGALCWRWYGPRVQVLLITSRETGRWVIPKGGVGTGQDGPEAARQEAWEEAGVMGNVATSVALGAFEYDKIDRKRHVARRCRVDVFAMRVERLLRDFPERGQRRRRWFDADKAARQVAEPALRGLLAALAEDCGPLLGEAGLAGAAPLSADGAR